MPFGKRVLRSDVAYSVWANHRLLAACSSLAAEQLALELRLSHAGILATLRHIYDGERVWLLCLRDTPAMGRYILPPGPAPELSLDALRQRWPNLWDGFRQWLEAQSEEDLEAEIFVQLPDGRPQLPRWKILRHVLAHSNFHRGQIVGMIRSLGQPPPAINSTDYFLS